MGNIAILGATSHIAKGLIFNFSRNKGCRLSLFARSPEKVQGWHQSFLRNSDCRVYDFKCFSRNRYDVVINCVGLGAPVKISTAGTDVFHLTEKFDCLVLDYLRRHPETRYINFSSGAIYTIDLGEIRPEHYYGVAKLYQEAKHRSLQRFNITDIRIFSYFSRFIGLDSGFFLTGVLESIRREKTFVTDQREFTRDFLSPADLFSLVCLVIKSGYFNDVIDAYSAAPVGKFELLDFFSGKYGLKYVVKDNLKLDHPTGRKECYVPDSRKAGVLLGYKPIFSSMRTITSESEYILG